MAHNIIVRTIEFGLFFTMIFHPFVGIVLWIRNRRARPDQYDKYKLQENTELASRFTMLTGSIIFLFLVIHLRTFFFPLRFGTTALTPAALVEDVFSSKTYSAFYLFALLVLGYHLRHGFQSAFQSLGLRNKKYTPLIDAIAVVFWLLIPLGYALIPIYFLFFHHAAGPMAAGVQ
jgi:succinate dehydrogenase / fumarate reductase cytochrome b subunit